MSPLRPLTLLLLPLLSLAAPVRAALVWSADFESYDTSGGAVPLTLDATGGYDTFSDSSNTAGTTLTTTVSGTGIASGMSGNALLLSMVNTTGGAITGSFARVGEFNLPSLGGAGLYVLSLDVATAAGSAGISSFYGRARTTGGGTSGDTLASFQSSLSSGSAVRYTLVINQSGSSITLPGALGSLGTGAVASYFYDGTTFGGFDDGTVASATVGGFGIGLNRSGSLANNDDLAAWMDNAGVWSSALDTVGGVSILALAPGTNPIPEPTGTALSLAALSTLLTLRQRRRLHS